jgi:hypothetical protein
MGELDAGAIVIGVLLLAGGAWALYNWTHPGTHSPK